MRDFETNPVGTKELLRDVLLEFNYKYDATCFEIDKTLDGLNKRFSEFFPLDAKELGF